jgi:hypothetical protein
MLRRLGQFIPVRGLLQGSGLWECTPCAVGLTAVTNFLSTLHLAVSKIFIFLLAQQQIACSCCPVSQDAGQQEQVMA